jgi:hypothetical protein
MNEFETIKQRFLESLSACKSDAEIADLKLNTSVKPVF